MKWTLSPVAAGLAPRKLDSTKDDCPERKRKRSAGSRLRTVDSGVCSMRRTSCADAIRLALNGQSIVGSARSSMVSKFLLGAYLQIHRILRSV